MSLQRYRARPDRAAKVLRATRRRRAASHRSHHQSAARVLRHGTGHCARSAYGADDRAVPASDSRGTSRRAVVREPVLLIEARAADPFNAPRQSIDELGRARYPLGGDLLVCGWLAGRWQGARLSDQFSKHWRARGDVGLIALHPAKSGQMAANAAKRSSVGSPEESVLQASPIVLACLEQGCSTSPASGSGPVAMHPQGQ